LTTISCAASTPRRVDRVLCGGAAAGSALATNSSGVTFTHGRSSGLACPGAPLPGRRHVQGEELRDVGAVMRRACSPSRRRVLAALDRRGVLAARPVSTTARLRGLSGCGPYGSGRTTASHVGGVGDDAPGRCLPARQ
jgi:hypothetical protein